jgi:alpha-beta hydrolase superfamily lysophospholipase
VIGFGLLAGAGPRVPIDTRVPATPVPPLDSLEGWIARREAGVAGLRAGAQARVRWADPHSPGRTSLAVVYLHGFSATPRETAPLSDSVAAGLGANLYYARLTGHGRDGVALAEASVADWLEDAQRAVAVGRRLGERLVLVGTSTGATLALYAAARLDGREAVAAVVAMSPNFGPADPAAGILLWPWGGTIARWVLGPTRSWEAANEEQAAFWTTEYPTGALLPMMGVVDLVDDAVLGDVAVPTLVLYSPGDEVIDVDTVVRRSAGIGEQVQVEAVGLPVGDPARHVLAGDILSPETTGPLARRIVRFIRESG